MGGASTWTWHRSEDGVAGLLADSQWRHKRPGVCYESTHTSTIHTLTVPAIDMHAPSLLALAPSLLALVTIVPLAPLGLTAPVANPVLATRKEFCANAPDTVAGT